MRDESEDVSDMIADLAEGRLPEWSDVRKIVNLARQVLKVRQAVDSARDEP